MRGTNFGNFSIDLEQQGGSFSGKAKFREPSSGNYECSISGSINNGTTNQSLLLRLTPTVNPSGLNLGTIEVTAHSPEANSLQGQWKTIQGRQGKFTARRQPADPAKPAPQEKSLAGTASQKENIESAANNPASSKVENAPTTPLAGSDEFSKNRPTEPGSPVFLSANLGSPRPPGSLADRLETALNDLLNHRLWSQSLRGVFRSLAVRFKPVWERGRIVRLTPENMVLALLQHGQDYKDDQSHVAGKLAGISHLTSKELDALLNEGVWLRPEIESQEPSNVIDPRLEKMFQRAERLAQTVSRDGVIAVRHLVTAILLPSAPGQRVGNNCQLPENIFPARRFTEALIEHIQSAEHISATGELPKWEEVINELKAGLSPIRKVEIKPDDQKAKSASVGGGLNFAREATPEEVCLRANEYAMALKNFFVASQKHGELCFALFGHWGRGKSFLMNLTSKLLTDYKTIRFSAWKYPNVPEVWVSLYENFAHAAYPRNPFESFPRIIRTGIAKHGGNKIIAALAILAFALFPKPDLAFLSDDLRKKIELVLGAGGIAWLFMLVSGIWKTTQRLHKDFLTATRHRDKLGLQATIGDDLEALLRGWMPGPQPKFCGWLFWMLAVLVCLIAGSAWWRIERVAPWLPCAAYVAVIVIGVALLVAMVLLGKGPKRVLLIVDDLDRCKPDQLLTVVESIKVLLEEPEISSRIQVAMLVEEDVLEQAILEKYRHMGIPDKSSTGIKIGLGWSNQRICRENAEKLFTAHLRLPPLINEELEEIMLKVVNKEPKAKNTTSETNTDAAADSVAGVTPGAPKALPTGKTPPAEQSNKSLPATPKQDSDAQTTIDKDIVFTDDDAKALLAALPVLQKSCTGFALGPRSVRAFAFRYQLTRLLLDQLKIKIIPAELARTLAENASFGKKVKPRVVANSSLQRIIDQVA